MKYNEKELCDVRFSCQIEGTKGTSQIWQCNYIKQRILTAAS
jgi:hypothetical protein